MSARILIVDDNPSNLELASYLLGEFGYDATAVADGPSGLAALRCGRYDAVLVDILMPQMDGYEFAALVRAEAASASLPLIALTALAMDGDRERILASGFDGYIAKPIEPTTFVADVEAYVSKNRTRGKDSGR